MSDDTREIRIIIEPAGDGWFAAFFGNLQLCASDRPFRGAARALLDLGAPRDAVLIASRGYWPIVMRAPLASAEEGFGGENVIWLPDLHLRDLRKRARR